MVVSTYQWLFFHRKQTPSLKSTGYNCCFGNPYHLIKVYRLELRGLTMSKPLNHGLFMHMLWRLNPLLREHALLKDFWMHWVWREKGREVDPILEVDWACEQEDLKMRGCEAWARGWLRIWPRRFEDERMWGLIMRGCEVWGWLRIWAGRLEDERMWGLRLTENLSEKIWKWEDVRFEVDWESEPGKFEDERMWGVRLTENLSGKIWRWEDVRFEVDWESEREDWKMRGCEVWGWLRIWAGRFEDERMWGLSSRLT